VLADGTGFVDNLQFYLASRRFATAAPQLVHAVIDSLAQLDAWAKTHPDDIARELAPVTGLPAATISIAARRASYGVVPVSPQVLAGQQTIADTFTELKLIPKQIAVKDAQWLA
jgi:sulfonate transport system substrate-binding protein